MVNTAQARHLRDEPFKRGGVSKKPRDPALLKARTMVGAVGGVPGMLGGGGVLCGGGGSGGGDGGLGLPGGACPGGGGGLFGLRLAGTGGGSGGDGGRGLASGGLELGLGLRAIHQKM